MNRLPQLAKPDAASFVRFLADAPLESGFEDIVIAIRAKFGGAAGIANMVKAIFDGGDPKNQMQVLKLLMKSELELTKSKTKTFQDRLPEMSEDELKAFIRSTFMPDVTMLGGGEGDG